MKRRVLLACALGLTLGSLLLAQGLAAQGKLTTVIIVRHAERGPDEGIESPITERGRERAEELARVLKDSGITKILVSEFVRTRQTTEPLAKRINIEPETVLVQPGVDALVKRVGELKGETILVSSHGGRIEPLIERLGGGKIERLGSTEYDNLFILTLPPSGPAKLVRLRYGAN